MNENYARDIGRKVKAAMRAKSSQKLAIGNPPYGYKRSENDKNLWVIDEEAADIVKWIFKKRLERGITWIERELRHKKIPKPALYAKTNGLKKGNKEILGDCIWTHSTVDNILKNPAYCGDIVNFKTFQKFKVKKVFKNETENMEVYKDVHEAIISREDFEEVQKTFTSKPGKPRVIEISEV